MKNAFSCQNDLLYPTKIYKASIDRQIVCGDAFKMLN